MMLVATELHYSSIHGLGVFASHDIPKGTLIWQLDEEFDRIIPEDLIAEWPAHIQELMRIYSYPYPFKEGVRMLDVDNGRFMNHSETPNTDFSTPDKGWATCDIKKGDEITTNYGEYDPGFEIIS